MNGKYYSLLLICIFLLGFFLRFYKLGEIPLGLYQDESAIGYNAYSLLITGKDEHGVSLPLYFKSFGDYKLPVYIYLTALSVRFFGLSEFAVRFPSAFFGFLTVIVFYFLINTITKQKTLSLIATFLLAINPWHVHYSRATFEVSIALFLYVLGTLCLYTYFQEKRRGFFLLGTLFFVINLYTYNLTRLLTPLLFIVTLFVYKHNIKKRYSFEIIFTGIATFFLLTPFLVTFFNKGGVSSASGTLIFSSSSVLAPLLEQRSYFAESQQIIGKLFFNMPVLIFWKYLTNIVSYFSVPFFFLNGSSHGNHGIGNFGQFYLFELMFIFIGINVFLKERFHWQKLFLSWFAIVILVASLTREAPHATRSFFLIVPGVLFSSVGLYTIYKKILMIKKSFVFSTALSFVALFSSYNVAYYFLSYYFRFPIAYASSWRSQDKAISMYIKENENKYNKIIFDTKSGFMYSSLLFYSLYPPQDFQKNAVWEKDDSEGFSFVKSFGKYEFRPIDWTKDYAQRNVLLITTDKEKPEKIPSLTSFYYPKRPVVLALKQEILQFPVNDVAYVLVETR